MTSSQHGSYVLGYTHATMAGTTGCEGASRSQSHQNRSQLGSQAETRLRERGIASNRRSEYCGEYVLGPCTHRPSRHGSRRHLKSPFQPRLVGEVGAQGGSGNWDEVVTR